MNFFNEYALLIAVAVPVLAIAGLNVFLWIGGERGTLLLPSGRDRQSSRGSAVATGAARPSVTDETPVSTGAATQAPANDPQVRAAA